MFRYRGDTGLTALELNQRYAMRPEILQQLESLYQATLPEEEENKKTEPGKSPSSSKKKK